MPHTHVDRCMRGIRRFRQLAGLPSRASLDISGMSQRKPPVLSIAAICCPLLIRGVLYFLATATARDSNERMFGRYYTLGMLLMVGFYAAIVLGLVGLGLALGIAARRRRETPTWLPWLALAANIVAPLAVLLWLTH